jgi:hypothetical protein
VGKRKWAVGQWASDAGAQPASGAVRAGKVVKVVEVVGKWGKVM